MKNILNCRSYRSCLNVRHTSRMMCSSPVCNDQLFMHVSSMTSRTEDKYRELRLEKCMVRKHEPLLEQKFSRSREVSVTHPSTKIIVTPSCKRNSRFYLQIDLIFVGNNTLHIPICRRHILRFALICRQVYIFSKHISNCLGKCTKQLDH